MKIIDNSKNTGYSCIFVEKRDYDNNPIYICSMCENTWQFSVGTPKDNDWDYCPSCASFIEKVESMEEYIIPFGFRF